VFKDSSKIKAASIKVFSALTEVEEKEFSKVISTVQNLVTDQEYFVLILLLVLTKAEADNGKHCLFNYQKKLHF
jgi:hypothetical protein